jgi:hypothetical protein
MIAAVALAVLRAPEYNFVFLAGNLYYYSFTLFSKKHLSTLYQSIPAKNLVTEVFPCLVL